MSPEDEVDLSFDGLVDEDDFWIFEGLVAFFCCGCVSRRCESVALFWSTGFWSALSSFAFL